MREQNAELRAACQRALCAATVLRRALVQLCSELHFDDHPEDFAPDWHQARRALAATARCPLCDEAECRGAHFVNGEEQT